MASGHGMLEAEMNMLVLFYGLGQPAVMCLHLSILWQNLHDKYLPINVHSFCTVRLTVSQCRVIDNGYAGKGKNAHCFQTF